MTKFKEHDIEFPKVLQEHGFKDESWKNDMCARATLPVKEGGNLAVWVDHKNPRRREQASARFVVTHEPNGYDSAVEGTSKELGSFEREHELKAFLDRRLGQPVRKSEGDDFITVRELVERAFDKIHKAADHELEWKRVDRLPGDDSEVHPHFMAQDGRGRHVAQVKDRDEKGEYSVEHESVPHQKEYGAGFEPRLHYRAGGFKSPEDALAHLKAYVASNK